MTTTASIEIVDAMMGHACSLQDDSIRPASRHDDYYTPEQVASLWDVDWWDRWQGPWKTTTTTTASAAGTTNNSSRAGRDDKSSTSLPTDPNHPVVRGIHPVFDNYHTYACHVCKRTASLTNTPLRACGRCHVMYYCGKEHQLQDWKYGHHKAFCNAMVTLQDDVDTQSYNSNLDLWRHNSHVIASTLVHGQARSADALPVSCGHYILMQPRCRRCLVAQVDLARQQQQQQQPPPASQQEDQDQEHYQEADTKSDDAQEDGTTDGKQSSDSRADDVLKNAPAPTTTTTTPTPTRKKTKNQLKICPRCSGVAMCTNCLKEYGCDSKNIVNSVDYHPNDEVAFVKAFHPTGISQPAGMEECDQYKLAISCSGMIVEQGCPLQAISDFDIHQQEIFLPNDWHAYVQRKRNHFTAVGVTSDQLRLAPTVALLTDSLSLPLTVLWVLRFPAVPYFAIPSPFKPTRLIVHVIGATHTEWNAKQSWIELLRSIPSLQYLRIVMIGPEMPKIDAAENDVGVPLNWQQQDGTTTTSAAAAAVFDIPILSHVDAKVLTRSGKLYHEVLHTVPPDLQRADMAIAPHAGLFDRASMSYWSTTIAMLAANRIPCVITGYNRSEIEQTVETVTEVWKLPVDWALPSSSSSPSSPWSSASETLTGTPNDGVVAARTPSSSSSSSSSPVLPNPFRGLRPILDPARDPSDFIHINCCLTVFCGFMSSATTAAEPTKSSQDEQKQQ